ncbi:restriction system protein [Desulfonatronum thiosulfatophilum]|uniref:Restriction system protein n=1 Tax=Desulfonatronum thiosulfatophilum TaxID=617002 RepID=A0A1G6BHZ2_9BACT|nr:restriction endonuclease [Desulfonatronum thiosulfatophilum]SDB20198.1 restriction system protein [Desulfonatronum thiosulfatophilum]
MARERTSMFEDIILAANKLPWWACFILAAVSYVILDYIASRPLPDITGDPMRIADVVAPTLVSHMAFFGKIILPLAFGFAGIASAINAYRQKKLFADVQSRPRASTLQAMSWQEFERLVAEHFRRQGFSVTRNGGAGPDGGVDLDLRKGEEIHLVQCKQWKAYKVGVQPVREFYGIMSARGAAGGFFITSGTYTTDARTFAHGLNLELIDGQRLLALIDQTRLHDVGQDASAFVPPADDTPLCPRCSARMTMRTARKGPWAGREFWGCVNFPGCKGTRTMDVDKT